MLIPTSQNIKTVTDMREDAVGMLNAVNKLGLVYVFQHSDPKAVMLSLDEFAHLQKLMEDYLDESEAAKLAKEPHGKLIPLSRVIHDFKTQSKK